MNTQSNSRTTNFPDEIPLTPEAIGIFVAAAYWMMTNHQDRVEVYKESEGFQLIITTDFSEEPITGTDLTGTVFEAKITEDGAVVPVQYVVHRIPQLPSGFGKGWEFSAFMHRFLQTTNPSRN